MQRFIVGVAFALATLVMVPIYGDGPVDVWDFESDEQRERYQALIEVFRCPKCLNTNIAGSDAPIAQDLRRTVHRLVVTEGYTDDEVTAYLQARYGDFVLYKPPFNQRTWLIWMMPVALLLVGVFVLYSLQRRARMASRNEANARRLLNEQDRQRLQTLLERD